jgi:hypothetical protein
VLIPILLLNLAASAPLVADVPLLEGSTSRSASEFEACFAGIQKAQSQPLWIVPYENGGARISNEGATGVTNPYQIRVVQTGAETLIRALVRRREGTEDRRLVESIKACG